MLINFVDATNDANHYTKPPSATSIRSHWRVSWKCIYLYRRRFIYRSGKMLKRVESGEKADALWVVWMMMMMMMLMRLSRDSAHTGCIATR